MLNNSNQKQEQKIQALFTDLDGTLLHKNKLSKKNIVACKNLSELKIPIIFNTGRDFSSVKKYLEKTGLDKLEGYCSCLCGALIYKLPEKKIINAVSINKDLLKTFIKDCEEKNISLTMYGENKIFLSKKTFFHWFLNKHYSNSKYPIIKSDADVNNSLNISEPIYKFIIYCPNALFKANAHMEKINYLKNKYANKLEIYTSNVFFSEITDKSINKGKAIEIISNLLNVPIENVAFIGDGTNDISGFKVAGFKVALTNSIPELVQSANFVAPHCKKHGFSYTINELFFNQKNN